MGVDFRAILTDNATVDYPQFETTGYTPTITDRSRTMHELLIADRIKGEREIAIFRGVLLALTTLMVIPFVVDAGYWSISDIANMIAVGVATIYTVGMLLAVRRSGYRRVWGFLSSTVDVLMISASIYLTRFAPESSVASLVSTSAFAVYFPIILFTIRRHDPANSLYTGLLAAAAYAVMILVMEFEGSFGITMKAGALSIRNDLVNEAIKAVFLAGSGWIGAAASRHFDRLFEDSMRQLAEKEHIKSMFGRYVSEELVERILSREIALEGERREATIMFIDIRNFTPLAEKVDPRTLIMVLNNFFDVCINTITMHGGFIDKFIDDAIMVVFGAPSRDERHRENAIRCAVALERALATMDAWVKSLGVDWEFGYGIGVNSGEVILGNVGTDRRMEYTAMGDAVNIASRLENLTRQVGKPILVGEDCARSCPAEFIREGPFLARLKGKSGAVKVYAIAAAPEAAP